MKQRTNSESGYVTAMTALLLIPLMIMAALSVDVGGWYAEAASVQTAADSAALAGVAYMPKLDAAVAAAMDEAARNGYVDADGHSQATYDTPTQFPQILVTEDGEAGISVAIKTESTAYFGKVVLDGIEIERRASSEFIRPVTMGNPSAQLGGGHLLDSSDTSNAFWLAVLGYCSRRANGMKSFSGFETTRVGCPGTTNNRAIRHSYTLSSSNNPMFSLGGQLSPYTYTLSSGNPNANDWYSGDGLRDDYFTIIELPPSSPLPSVNYDVDIYRPGACAGVHEGQLGSTAFVYRNGNGANSDSLTNPQILTRLYNADTTQADRWDSIVAGNYVERLWSLDDCNGDDGTGWYTIGTVASHPTERRVHYLSYGTEEDLSEFWLNTFALRVVPSNDPAASICVDTAVPSSCPTIGAVDNMPIYISDVDEYNAQLLPAGSPVSFFLGNVIEEHAGKKFIIKLYDTGEGMQNLQILDPHGVPVDFVYFSDACDTTNFCGNFGDISVRANDNCGGTPCLDVTNYRFQSNEVTMAIDLPSDYTCGSDCWWRVRYDGGGGFVHDATEWSITVTGDPIRLTD